MTTTAIVLIVIGGAIFMGGIFISQGNHIIEGIAMILLGSSLVATGCFLRGEQVKEKEFAKEINLNYVTMKGQTSFSAQIKIVCEDGELFSVKLIPNTTVFIKKAEEKK